MEHLPVHLADEALFVGIVNLRWMYPVERFLLTLKLYVRNRTYPEDPDAKAYIAEECMTFCARYLEDVETKNNRPGRNDDVDNDTGRCMGKATEITLDDVTRTQAHRYVLFNTEAVEPYLEMHLNYLKKTIPRNQAHRIQTEHNEKFDSRFKDYVCSTKDNLSEDIKLLALGPHMDARRYNGYIVNGFRFRIKDVDLRRKSQNSGVMLNASVPCFASRKDKNPLIGDVNFYGELIDIIEIRYNNFMKYVLFKWDWIDTRTGMMKDEFQFTLVNFKHKLYKENRVADEPFILATQAQQEDPDAREKLFVDTFGKDTHGRMQCMGQSITPIMIYGRRSGSTSVESVTNVRAKFKEKMEMQKQEMEARIQVERKAMEARIQAERETHRLEMEAFKKEIFQQLQSQRQS